MIIHTYTMCYNEEILMPYFLRYYEQFSDKIYVFDNYSSDSTPEIVDAHPKTVRTLYGDRQKHYNSILIRMKNEVYKKSRGIADWVIVVDVDEFLYHTDITSLLKTYKIRGITIPKTQGYDMIGDSYPTTAGQLYEEVNEGVCENFYSKRAVFNPCLDINYEVGAHSCNPRGNVFTDESVDIKLLHYRFLCKEFFIRTMRRRMERVSEEDKIKQWGALLLPPGETVESWSSLQYDIRKKNRVRIV